MSLGQSGRFIQLQPLSTQSSTSFMARMAIGSGWATVSSAQQQQVIEHLSGTNRRNYD